LAGAVGLLDVEGEGLRRPGGQTHPGGHGVVAAGHELAQEALGRAGVVLGAAVAVHGVAAGVGLIHRGGEHPDIAEGCPGRGDRLGFKPRINEQVARHDRAGCDDEREAPKLGNRTAKRHGNPLETKVERQPLCRNDWFFYTILH
jgi:hypothetical protein